MRIVGIDSADAAMQVLARYFPMSAQDTAKQRFLLKHLAPTDQARSIDAPTYAGRGVPPRTGGEPFDLVIGDFLQAYYLAPDIAARADAARRATTLLRPALRRPRRRHRRISLQALGPVRPPPWIKSRDRYLDVPWWPIGEGDPALMEYLTWSSPPEFASRNILTDEAPLRRATQPPVAPIR